LNELLARKPDDYERNDQNHPDYHPMLCLLSSCDGLGLSGADFPHSKGNDKSKRNKDAKQERPRCVE
jgi:hypothetical protein